MCDLKPLIEGKPVEEGKLFSFKLDDGLMERVEQYIKSPNAIAKFKNQLFNLAITKFLDREEIISRELERERSRIEEIIRRDLS